MALAIKADVETLLIVAIFWIVPVLAIIWGLRLFRLLSSQSVTKSTRGLAQSRVDKALPELPSVISK